MGKVTSKLQVTLPKAIADQYRIKPGDEIIWIPAGETIRVLTKPPTEKPGIDARLHSFDEATRRQKARNRAVPVSTGARGWTREGLYDRGRSR